MLSCDIQATAISYQEKGILIQGVPGVGKTSLALRLIENGAVLLGDDLVKIFIRKGQLYCQGKKKLKGVVEIRGLGLIKGFKVAPPVPVLCVIQLHKKSVERLPKSKKISLLGKKIPVFDFYACETNDIQVLYAIRILSGVFSLLKE